MKRKQLHDGTHLTIAERKVIQAGIENSSTKADIARTIGKDATTVAKEIRKHREFKPRNTFNSPVYGILNGYDDFDNMADFLKQNESYFKNLLLIDKTPSHDCLSDLFSAINPEKFMEIFVKWITSIVELKANTIISIDGKAVRSARDKIKGGNTPYILSAFMSEIGISIGQVSVDKKSNEIKAIPDLLKILDIRDCFITIDAMGTQETIARGIIKAGGHYVLKVKKNQPTLMEDVKSYFDENAFTDTIELFING